MGLIYAKRNEKNDVLIMIFCQLVAVGLSECLMDRQRYDLRVVSKTLGQMIKSCMMEEESKIIRSF